VADATSGASRFVLFAGGEAGSAAFVEDEPKDDTGPEPALSSGFSSRDGSVVVRSLRRAA